MIAHRWKFCGLAAVLVASWQASALADGGRMSRATLDEMGLTERAPAFHTYHQSAPHPQQQPATAA